MNNVETQTLPKPDDKNYLWMALVVCILGFILIKEIIIPRPILLAMTGIAGIILLFKGAKKPELITYALVAYLPFSKELAGDFGGLAMALNFTNILMFFMIWVWFTGRYAQGEPKWISTPLNLPIILFIVIGLISICRGSYLEMGNIGYVIINYKRWITPIILFFLVLNTVKDKTTIRNVAIIIMLTTVVVALMAIYDYIDQGESGSLEKSRIGGVADQPNQLAAFFNYYMFLLLGFFLLNVNRFNYWWLLVAFALCFRGIMVTFSRGGYMSFAIGTYAITFFRSKILFIILIVLSVFIYFNPVLIPAGIRYRMGQTVDKNSDSYSSMSSGEIKEENLDASARTRVDIWRAGIQMVKDNPVFGVGYGLFPPMLKYYLPGVEMDSHNTYLILAAEMGIPALVIFLWIIGMIIWYTRDLYLHTADHFAKALALGWLGGLFAMLLNNMFGSRLDSQEISSYLWIISALIMRLRMLDAKELQTTDKGFKKIGYNV